MPNLKTMINVALIAAVSLLFTACTSSGSAPMAKSPSFKLGEKDGCTTASGAYTKNSDSFKMDADYKNGWFYGRKQCNTQPK
jgi:hypothetical protein